MAHRFASLFALNGVPGALVGGVVMTHYGGRVLFRAMVFVALSGVAVMAAGRARSSRTHGETGANIKPKVSDLVAH